MSLARLPIGPSDLVPGADGDVVIRVMRLAEERSGISEPRAFKSRPNHRARHRPFDWRMLDRACERCGATDAMRKGGLKSSGRS